MQALPVRMGLRRAVSVGCICALGLAAAACGSSRPAPAPVQASPSAEPSAAPPAPAASSSAPATVPDLGLLIPILMYHVIAVPAPGAPLPGLYVAPTLFAAQVRALQAAGYQAVTLAQAYAYWQGQAQPPAHPVVLSFDDGYTSVYSNALPVLRAMGWPGVLCQQVQRIDFPGGFTAAQIRTMLAAGWELAAHAVTQPEVDLTTASAAVVHWEVFSSRSALQQRFGVPVRFFCYPVGHYDPAAVAAVRAAGYVGALSTVPGPADPAVQGMFRLERLRVWAGESPAQVVAEVQAAGTAVPAAPPLHYGPPPPLPARPQSSTAGGGRAGAPSSATAGRQTSGARALGSSAQGGGVQARSASAAPG